MPLRCEGGEEGANWGFGRPAVAAATLLSPYLSPFLPSRPKSRRRWGGYPRGGWISYQGPRKYVIIHEPFDSILWSLILGSIVIRLLILQDCVSYTYCGTTPPPTLTPRTTLTRGIAKAERGGFANLEMHRHPKCKSVNLEWKRGAAYTCPLHNSI